VRRRIGMDGVLAAVELTLALAALAVAWARLSTAVADRIVWGDVPPHARDAIARALHASRAPDVG
jgi:hypothetical protein